MPDIRTVDAITILLAATLLLSRCHSIDESRYTKEPICHVQERMDDGCSREVSGKALIRCLAACSSHITCVGASFVKSTRKCFIHQECSPRKACATPDANHDYFAKYCVHGRFDKDSDSCVCNYGTFGPRCNKGHRTCSHLHPAGFPDGTHLVFLDPKDDGDLYMVYCSIIPTYAVQFAMFNSGSSSFNRSWGEFSYGFQTDDLQTFWIGLNVWHIFSTYGGCNFMMLVLGFKTLPVIYRRHYNFFVGSKEDNFPFTFEYSYNSFDEHTSDIYEIGPCMDAVRGAAFSTWDRDNDGNGGSNCASLAGAGWWHPSDCDNPCNVLAWGLDDWTFETRHQRFSMLDVDMPDAIPEIETVSMYLIC